MGTEGIHSISPSMISEIKNEWKPADGIKKATVREDRIPDKEKMSVAATKEDTAKEVLAGEKEKGNQVTDDKYSHVMAEKAVENANNRVRSMGTNTKFEYNDDINRIVITITDRSNNEIVKEIPTEDTQKMLEKIHTLSGMVVDAEV